MHVPNRSIVHCNQPLADRRRVAAYGIAKVVSREFRCIFLVQRAQEFFLLRALAAFFVDLLPA